MTNRTHIALGNDFRLEELVPKEIYVRYGSRSIYFLDPVSVSVLVFMRKRYGRKCTVNTWLWGGSRDEAGFRLPTTKTGSKLSQHKFGRAFDPQFDGMEPIEVYDDILANESLFMDKGLTTLEDPEYTPSWTHFDTRPTNQNSINIVRPR